MVRIEDPENPDAQRLSLSAMPYLREAPRPYRRPSLWRYVPVGLAWGLGLGAIFWNAQYLLGMVSILAGFWLKVWAQGERRD